METGNKYPCGVVNGPVARQGMFRQYVAALVGAYSGSPLRPVNVSIIVKNAQKMCDATIEHMRNNPELYN